MKPFTSWLEQMLAPFFEKLQGQRKSRRPKQQARRQLLEALEDRTLLSVTLFDMPSWVEQGPGPITNGNNVIGIPDQPQSGAANSVAIDPTNLDHVFVATADGGIWRTNNFTDADPIWTPVIDQFPSLAIVDIQYSPLDLTGNTLFAGSGGFSNDLGDGNPTTGVLKTTDNGDHWLQLGQSNFGGLTIQAVIPTKIIDPGVGPGLGGQVVLAATRNNAGLFRSADGGLTWTQISGTGNLPTGRITDLQADPGNILRFYAALPAQFDNLGNVTRSGRVYISNDGGVNWTNISAGVAGINNAIEVKASVHNSAGNNVVYAAVLDPVFDGLGNVTSTPFAGVSRSTNQGGAWTPIGPGSLPNTNPGGQSRNFALTADPGDPNLVFVSGDRGTANNAGDIFRGDAVANTWTSVANGGASGTAPHPDARQLIFDSSGAARILVACNDGGIYRLFFPSGGGPTVWGSALGNIRPTEFFAVSFDTINGVVFGGTQDNSTPEQVSPGSFTWDDNTGGDGENVGVDNTSNPDHSLHYTSSQNLGQRSTLANDPNFNRETFDDANALVLSEKVLTKINNTGGQNLYQVEANNPAPPGGTGSTIQFFTPWVLNNVDPTKMIIGTNSLYESTSAKAGDALDALGGVTDTGGGQFRPTVQVGQVSALVGSNPIAYGGYSGGVANTQVLWVGAGGNLRLRTSGTGVPSVVANYTGGTVLAVVMDPTDWHTAYVVDANGNVFQGVSNDAGTSVAWTNVTGNLASGQNRYRTIECIRNGADRIVLLGGLGGVFRTVNPGANAVWTGVGQGLPNANVRDLHYVAPNGDPDTGDLLVVGTDGRGAWTLPNATATLLNPNAGILQIYGDEDSPNQNDTIRLIRDQLFPIYLDVFVNGVLEMALPIATVQQINVNSLGGIDILIVDSSNGLIKVPNGINYDGGAGFNSLQLIQTGGPTRTADSYSVGPNAGQGTSVISATEAAVGVAQSVFFQNLAPVLDLVPAASLIVNATADANVINYTQGSVAANGKVTIENFELIDFSNKTALTINALVGNDLVNLNNSATPTSLTSITVNAGDGDDTVTTLASLPAAIAVTFNGGDGHDYLSAAGASGAATLSGGTGNDTLIGGSAGDTLSGGAGEDTLDGRGGANTLNGGPDTDTILVSGTAGPDTITATHTAGNFNITGGLSAGSNAISNIERVRVEAGEGADAITLILLAIGGLNYTVLGGNPIGTLSGDSLAVNSARTKTVTPGPESDAGSVDVATDTPTNVSYDEIELLILGGGGPAVINGTNGPDTLTVIARDASTHAGANGVQDFTVSVNTGAEILFLNTPSLTVNALAGSDQVTLVTPAPNNAVWDVDVTVNGSVPSADTDRLIVQTPVTGSEAVVYTPTTAEDGSLDLGASLSSLVTLTGIEGLYYDGQGDNDSLTVVATAGQDTITHTPGANDQAGTFQVNALLPINYQNLGSGGSLTADGAGNTDTLVYAGTSANDSFSVGAVGQVNLNSRLVVNQLAVENLRLEGYLGDDTFTLLPTISANPYTTIHFNGGAQASATGDQANLTAGAAADVTVSGQTVSQNGKTVAGSGLENINLNGALNALIYNGIAGLTENVNVYSSPTANAGKLLVEPGVVQVTFTNLPSVDVNGNAPDNDTLRFYGTNNVDVLKINLEAAGTTADPILTLRTSANALLLTLRGYTGINTLNVNTLDSNDVINVYTSAALGISRNLFVDGELPAGKNKATDTLNVFYTPKRPKIVQQGSAQQDPDSGTMTLDYDTAFFSIGWTGIEVVTIRQGTP